MPKSIKEFKVVSGKNECEKSMLYVTESPLGLKIKNKKVEIRERNLKNQELHTKIKKFVWVQSEGFDM